MIPPFQEGRLYAKYGAGGAYATENPGRSARFPSLVFYLRLLAGPFRWLAWRASRGRCDDFAWTWSSAWVGDILESQGGRIFVEGMDNIASLREPVVYVANHMSTLETFLLPGLLRPHGKVTFVVKKSLVEMPLFGPIMRSRDPISVARRNPREDLAKVLQEGSARLAKGFSLVIFPQSTRSRGFEREHFNSLGVKLAKRANVPIVPIALKTDAWGLGRRIAELGKIRPEVPVRIKIGAPLKTLANGKEEHQAICDFIEANLTRWQNEDGASQ